MSCFDEDPNEGVEISGSDFAAMCDEIKRLKEIEHRAEVAEAELNRLRCALQDQQVASGVLSAFWRRVYGAANFCAFDKQVLVAHMLTALTGVEVFSRRELASVTCPDCGPVMVNPDIWNAGIPIGGVCPQCGDRLHFEPESMSGEAQPPKVKP